MLGLVITGAAAAISAATFTPMNGNYEYSNGPQPGQPGSFRGTNYFEIETEPYTTTYAEVDWDVRTVPLDPKLVQQFDGKLINFVGYEFDLIRLLDNGTERSAHAWELYNHHYANSIIGKGAKLVKTGIPYDHKGPMGRDDDDALGEQPFPGYKIVPTSTEDNVRAPPPRWSNAGLIMGNGAESRKTFHYIPPGYGAQVFSPYQAVLHPMLIDTTNREPAEDPAINPAATRHGPVPAKSNVPPSAMYSGLMECPCTDKFVKHISSYSTLESGVCQPNVERATDCYAAAVELGLKPVVRNMTVTDPTYPVGCSTVATVGGFEVVFNTLNESATKCGAPPSDKSAPRVAGMAQDLVGISLDIDPAHDLVTMNFTGPSDVWFGVGIGAAGKFNPADPSSGLSMMGTNWTIVMMPDGTVMERHLGNHEPGDLLPQSVKVVSNTVVDGLRTVSMTRSIEGAPTDQFVFDSRALTLPFINAIGSSADFVSHANKSTGVMYFVELDHPTCICNVAGDQGTLGGYAWGAQRCVDRPLGQMLDDPNWPQTGRINPTCSLKYYSGGLRCCKGGTILLDSNQTVPQTQYNWKLKYRYYYEEGSEDPATVTDTFQSSWWTEHNNNENDVPLCLEQNKSLCQSTITSNFTAGMFGGCENGCKMIHMEGHCHIGCIRMEMWIMDDPANPKLLCRTEVDHGKSDAWMDEMGYIAGAQPCIFGNPSDGFTAPVPLYNDTKMMSVKIQNNTYARYGDMGLWELRAAPLS